MTTMGAAVSANSAAVVSASKTGTRSIAAARTISTPDTVSAAVAAPVTIMSPISVTAPVSVAAAVVTRTVAGIIAASSPVIPAPIISEIRVRISVGSIVRVRITAIWVQVRIASVGITIGVWISVSVWIGGRNVDSKPEDSSLCWRRADENQYRRECGNQQPHPFQHL